MKSKHFAGVLAALSLIAAVGNMRAQNLWTEEILSFRKNHVENLLKQVEVIKNVEYARTPEQVMLLDVYLPPGKPERPLPAVIWIHGGGLKNLDKDYELIRWCAAYTALAGFVSISVEYRLVGTAPLPAAIEDCKTAVRFIRKNAAQFHIEPERVGVGGESAGGYLAALVATADSSAGFDKREYPGVSSRVQCGVLWYPVTTRYDFKPVDYVTPDDPPVLLLHGDRDKVVSIDESYTMKKKYEEAGAPVELHIVKNADHGFPDIHANVEEYRKHMEEALKESVRFFRKYLGRE